MIERWGRRRFVAGHAFALTIALLAVLPPLLAIATSFTRPTTEGWSGSSYAYVLDTYGPSLLISLKLAITVVVASLLLGAPAGYAFARSRSRSIAPLEVFALLPLSVPGITLAIGIMTGYAALRGEWLLIAAAQTVYATPYVVAIVGGGIRNVPLDELESAARTLGAGSWTRFRHIVAPELVHPVMIAALVVFAIAWGEFNVTFLLATPLNLPFAAALYDTFTSNSPAVSGAATAIFLAGALPFLVAIQFVRSLRTTPEQAA